MKKFLPTALIVGITVSSVTTVYAQPVFPAALNKSTYEVSSELNEESDNVSSYGYLTSELDGDAPAHTSDISLYSQVPNKYPDDMETLKNTYPANRNQNPYGTCWSFASMGLAEFDLINDGAADSSIDLSELQLVYFLFNSVVDPLGGTEGDFTKYYNENTSTLYLDYGGNYELASRRLAQWVGAIPESEVPYTQVNDVLSNGLDSKYAYNYNVAHLHNVYRVSISQNTDDVKQQIMQHGAVGVMYYHDNMSLSFSENGANYYDTAFTGGGHSVMIVGWDDTYSKDNFLGDKPNNDGAWLVRNSWGSYVDYFWMSYETKSLMDTAWVFDFVANDGYDNNYQLDGGLETYKASYTTMANVFTAKNDSSVKSETLKAVSLSTLRVADVSYKIEVYTDLTDEKNPLSGTKQESATTQGKTAYAGIYTVELNDEVKITPGSKFAIVVTVDKAALDCEQATNVANGENLSNMIWERAVSLYNEKTFFQSGNTFLANPSNLCVKALTSDDVEEPEQPTTPEEPEQPTTPEEPEKPTTPEEPEKPTTPEEPEKPTTAPEKPTTPEEPEKPTTPEEPEKPTTPEEPTTAPEKPTTPEEPTTAPEKPTTPEEPTTAPEKPTTPEEPTTAPEKPTTPEEPDESDAAEEIANAAGASDIQEILELPAYAVNGFDYSSVFNANYYYVHNEDLANAFGKDASALFRHFINYGVYEGRQASDAFNPMSYKDNYADLAAAFGDNISMYYTHYITYGKTEGRIAASDRYISDGIDYTDVFDPEYYYNNQPDVANAYGNDAKALFNHFITYGINEGRQASPAFNLDAYRNNYSDLVNAFGSYNKAYYDHFVLYGESEGRIAADDRYVYEGTDYTDVFDADYYRNNYGDLAAAFGSDKAALFSHFTAYGMSEGRQASDDFNVYTYMNRYNDLADAFGNDLQKYYEHYIKFGISEGRSAK